MEALSDDLGNEVNHNIPRLIRNAQPGGLPVVPSNAEEWSGLGSRDIDGQACGPNEREANESIARYLLGMVRDVSVRTELAFSLDMITNAHTAAAVMTLFFAPPFT